MTRPYSRVYHELVDDPHFAAVYDNDRAFAAWVRMLMLADAMWPASAPMPAKNATVRQLIDCGLVLERPGNRYTIRGLDKERQYRSDSARNAAAMRWQSKGNASAMPRRDETNKDEPSNGANAPTFMGKPPAALFDGAPQRNVDGSTASGNRGEHRHPDPLPFAGKLGGGEAA